MVSREGPGVAEAQEKQWGTDRPGQVRAASFAAGWTDHGFARALRPKRRQQRVCGSDGRERGGGGKNVATDFGRRRPRRWEAIGLPGCGA